MQSEMFNENSADMWEDEIFILWTYFSRYPPSEESQVAARSHYMNEMALRNDVVWRSSF